MEERVWKCEHGAARALLTYYEVVANNNFDTMVKTTLSFACPWVRQLSYAECGELYRELRTRGAQK
ncbi:hypothetical protein [Thermodesulfitimonas sp.]